MHENKKQKKEEHVLEHGGGDVHGTTPTKHNERERDNVI
jgi:hypothetical protein